MNTLAYWLSEAWTELKWRTICRWWMIDDGSPRLGIIKHWGLPRHYPRMQLWGYVKRSSAEKDRRLIQLLRTEIPVCSAAASADNSGTPAG